jgi:hypothetical protein
VPVTESLKKKIEDDEIECSEDDEEEKRDSFIVKQADMTKKRVKFD